MDKQCAVCKQEIDIKNNIYRGFDCTFCSTYCRIKMWSSIYQEDTNFNNPQLWSNKTDKKEAKNTWKVDVPKPKKDNDVENSKLTQTYESQSETETKKKSDFPDDILSNISDYIPNKKIYSYCDYYSNYNINNIMFIKNIKTYMLKTIESSMNIF